jgi:hypothetical protein
MAYSKLEDAIVNSYLDVNYPPLEPEEPSLEGMQLAAGPSSTMTDAGVRLGRAGVTKQQSEAAGGLEKPLGAMLDMGAATVKGVGQSFVGLGGDFEMIGRGVAEIFNRGAGEDKIQAFMRGIQQKTILPKTDEIKKWLDANVGMVNEGKNPYESIGEIVAPGGYVKGAKKVLEGATAAGTALGKITSKSSGEIYATAKQGPFYTVNKRNPETYYGDAGGRRIYPGTAIENRSATGRSSVYGDETGKADQEIQFRLKPENNPAFSIADQIAKKSTGKPYEYNIQMEPSSLRKQSAVGIAYDVAANKTAGYGDSVFAAYKADPEYAPIIEKLKIKSYDDLVKKSYEQLEKETIAQFNALPINMSYHKGGEGNYLDSKEMLKDVHLHNHLYVYQGGDQHEFLKNIDKGTGLNSNEMFRAVHDYFGHAIKGNTFGPVGEETAWASHAQMYSPLARIAMTAETRGQNSFVNYTPINAKLAEQMENVRRAMLDSERSGNLDKVEQYKQALRDLGGQMQYAKQASVALPPEMTRIDYSGGTPDYLRSVQSPQGEELALEHYSKSAEMSETDPGKYGTAAAGREAERLSMKGAKKERTFFYEAGSKPEQVVVSVAPYKYEAVGKGLYDFDNDPLDIRQLAKVKNTSTIGVRDEASLRNDLERIIYERGFKGYVTGNKGNRVVVSFDPVEVKRTK